MKILLLEDDAATVESIRLCLALYYPESEVVSIVQGHEAIERLKSDGFSIVLIDLGLPDIDGLEVLKEIRGFSKVPVLIISARYGNEAKARAKDLGANGYITKPFDFHFLIKRLGEITGSSPGRKI